MVSKVLLVAAPIVANGLQIAQHRSGPAMTQYENSNGGVAIDALPTLQVYEAYDWGTTYSMVLVDDCSKSTVRKCAGQSGGCDSGDLTYGYCGAVKATRGAKQVDFEGPDGTPRTGYFTGMCTDGSGQNGKMPSSECLGNSTYPNIAGEPVRQLKWCMTSGDGTDANDFTTRAVPWATQPCSGGDYGDCGETACAAAFSA